MDATEAFRRRMAFAFARWQSLAYPEKPNQTDLGIRVGKRAHRTYTQTAVAGWLAGKIPRELDSMNALSAELNVDPGWLYFERGEAPAGWAEAKVAMEAVRVAKDVYRKFRDEDEAAKPRTDKRARDRMVPRDAGVPKKKRRGA